MIFKESKTIYLQIADRIMDEILQKVYLEQERIPSVRDYAAIVEVNPTYSIVCMEGMPQHILELYTLFKECDCLLQYVSSGVIAVTKSYREQLSEFLEMREEQHRRSLENVES